MDSDWSELPKHLLDSISERLWLPSDYLQFSAVCKSWHCVAKDNLRGRAKISSNHIPPKLLIPTGEEKENTIIRLPPLTLLNQLARHKWEEEFDYYVYKATISADPILNADDCVVVVIFEPSLRMAFIRLKKDNTWTYVDKKWRFIQDVIHVEKKFYAVDGLSNLLSFDFTLDVKVVVKRITQRHTIKKYLVDLNGKEFWMVQRYLKMEDGKYVTKQFRVFEVNFDEHKWIEKSTLGNIALFLGDNSTISVSTSNFPDCQPNFIFFHHDNYRCNLGFDPSDVGVYDFRNRNFLDIYSAHAKTLLEMARRPPIWVVPTFQAIKLASCT